MRYLAIVDNLGLRGTQRAAVVYACEMSRRGQEVVVLTKNGLGPRLKDLKEFGIPAICLNDWDRALEEVGQFAPELIHLHRRGCYDPLDERLLSAINGNQKAVVFETNVFARVDYELPSGMIDLHLQISDWCLWKWTVWGRRMNPRPLGTVIPYPISETWCRSSENIRQDDRKALGFRKTDVVFGRIGGRDESKWDPGIFTVIRKVLERCADCAFLMVGAPHSHEQLAEKLPACMRQRVVILPEIQGDEKLARMYSCLDVFIHASKIGESFGMVLAEALACQVPVVTLATPLRDNSQCDLIGDGYNGYIATNFEHMCAILLTMASDHTLRLAMGLNGRQHVLTRFGARAVAGRLLDLANAALEKKRNGQRLNARDIARMGLPMPTTASTRVDEIVRKLTVWRYLQFKLIHSAVIYRRYFMIRRYVNGFRT